MVYLLYYSPYNNVISLPNYITIITVIHMYLSQTSSILVKSTFLLSFLWYFTHEPKTFHNHIKACFFRKRNIPLHFKHTQQKL